MTPNPDLKVTPLGLFDAEYPRKGARQRHGYNGLLIGTYTCPYSRCHFDWCWVAEIFSETKHR